MSKGKEAANRSFMKELFRSELFKRTQGRVARQVTFAAVAIIFALGAWQLLNVMKVARPGFLFTVFRWFGYAGSPGEFWSGYSSLYLYYWIPGLILFFGIWLGYRLVNFPAFADFLIAVEAEMNKVSWPSRQELMRASIVVIVVIFFLAAVLFAFDIFWDRVFTFLGVIREASPDR